MGTKNNPAPYDCYANAEPDEPMFVLLARDVDAPATVRIWAARRFTRLVREHGDSDKISAADKSQLDEACKLSDAMTAWRAVNRPSPLKADNGELPHPPHTHGELVAADDGGHTHGVVSPHAMAAETMRRREQQERQDRALVDAEKLMKWETDPRKAAGIPRRICVDQYVDAETKIRDAIIAIEYMAADVRLTNAQGLLSQAQGLVADFVEGVPLKVAPPAPAAPPAIGQDPVADYALDPRLQWFAYGHLPPQLQAISKPFGDLARDMCRYLPRNDQRTEALQRLIEAKDAAVRAFLWKSGANSAAKVAATAGTS